MHPNYHETVRLDVTDEAAAHTNAGSYSVSYRVVSDRNVMLRFDGEDAEQEDSMPLPADWPEFVTVQPGAAISFVLREGDSDGHIWLTRVT